MPVFIDTSGDLKYSDNNSIEYPIIQDRSAAQATSGIGRAITLQSERGFAGTIGGKLNLLGGAGGTSGTNKAGNVVIGLGAPVTNVTAYLGFESTPGTQVLAIGQYDATSVCIRAGTGIPTPGAGGLNALYIQGEPTVVNSQSTLYLNATSTIIQSGPLTTLTASTSLTFESPLTKRSNSSVQYEENFVGTTAISSATTTNLRSYTTTSNRVYRVNTVIVVSNDTDNEGVTFEMCASFKNVAGTVTQIGTTLTSPTNADAGQTGLVASIDSSGPAIRIRLLTDSADTVNVNEITTFYERVLV